MVALACYQPEIAQNLGNMIRTCACFGAPIHVIEPCGFPFSTKALKRSAMDYSEHAQIHHHKDWVQFSEQTILSRRVLLTTKSTLPYADFHFQIGDILVVGQESAGVPASVVKDCEFSITIPMKPGRRSLNVSTAAAIVLSEALRQNDALNF